MRTISELLEECSRTITREEIESERVRLIGAIARKHNISEDEVPALIREHRYVHSEDDIEDEYIGIMAFHRAAYP